MCGGKWVWGLFFIILGSVWIASNLGIIDFNIWAWWPLILVFIGVSIIFAKPHVGWEKMEFKENFEDMDWDEFGKGMKQFGKTMEKTFGKKKKKSKKRK